MSDSTPRKYAVQVEQVILFYGEVSVTAKTEEEAHDLAIEAFKRDWSKAFEVRTTTHVWLPEEP